MKLGTVDVKRLSAGGTLAREARLGTQQVYSIFNDPVSALFFRRQTAGGVVTNPALPQYGKALLSTIKGNSMVWNQLADVLSTISFSGLTFTTGANGYIKINGTAGESATISIVSGMDALRNHTVIYGSSKQLPVGASWSGIYNVDRRGHVLGNLSNTFNGVFSLTINSGTVFNNDEYYFQVYDLTLFFNGAVPDGYTVADFERDYPLDYYDYNPGEIIDLTGQGLETVGFNQWDEEWESGDFNNSGQPTVNPNWIRSKNFCPILPSTNYYRKSTTTCYFLEYDSDYNYIGVKTTPSFTSSSNAAYFKLQIYGTTYHNDICINISNASKNGTYEPYWKATKNLGLDDIRVSSPNVWDEEWEVGALNTDNGNPETNVNNIRSKNFQPILPDTAYYGYRGDDSNRYSLYICFYNSSKAFISYVSINRREVTTPATAAYFKIFTSGAVGVNYGDTYNYDITINLSSASLNGKYFPRRVPGLAKAGSAYDEINASTQKYVKRLIEVDLGDLTYTASPTAQAGKYRFISSNISGIKASTANTVCSRYTSIENTYAADKDGYIIDGQTVIIYSAQYATSDAATFKTAMAGVKMKVELATPEEYDLESPMDAEYRMDYLGTEALIPENSSTPSTAKFSAEIKYPK